jgi:hypothetical protein
VAALAPAFARAQALSPAYSAIVERYLAGDRAGAVAEIGTRPEERLREDRAAVDTLRRAAQTCPACPAAAEWRRIARAALMLLTDCAQQARRDGKPAHARESEAAGVARALATDPDLRAFAERWYGAMAGLAQGDNRWAEALGWAQAGLRDVPESPRLLLVVASIEETQGVLELSSAGDPLAGVPESEKRARLARLHEALLRLADAQGHLREALLASPGLVEARLRLGRVEWRLGQSHEARASFDAVLAQGPANPTAFLAHMFLGRLHEDAGRLPEALRCYGAALALQPSAQSARLALSHARLRLGDAAAARAEAGTAVGAGGHRLRDDPYSLYPWGASVGAEERLEDLRREASS